MRAHGWGSVRVVCVALLFAGFGPGRVPHASALEGADLTGYVETDNRFTIEGKSRFVYNENTLGMAVWASPSRDVSLLGSFRVRAIGLDERLRDDNLLTIQEQQDRTQTDPIQFILDEAYMNVSSLVWEDLDLKIGKQRIHWGTGDQFNPTDNLNPDDLHDPLQFGKKVPTVALQANYYLQSLRITGVVLPLFEPSVLPVTDIRPVFELQFEKMASSFVIDTGDPVLDLLFDTLMTSAIQAAELGEIGVASELPDRSLENVGAALKLSSTIGGVDASASYAYVIDDWGVPRRVTMRVEPFAGGIQQLVDTVDIEILQAFPRLHVFGADFAGNVPGLDVGVWGEVAVTLPEGFTTEYVVDAGPTVNGILSVLAGRDLSGGVVISREDPLADPYVKAVAGFDYTFPGAYYVNVQYVRGLPSDNTADLIADYVFGGFEKPLLHDSVKPRVFAGYCFQDESMIVYPQVFWYPKDSLEFHIGTFFVVGEPDTKFGAFGDSIAFFKAKLSF